MKMVQRKRQFFREEGGVVSAGHFVATPNWLDVSKAEVERTRVSELAFDRNNNCRVYRFLNFSSAVVLGLFSLPLLVLGIVLIWTADRKPFLFRQVRMGLNGNPFTIFKLRTMRVDAEKGIGAVWAKPDDDRIIRFGRFLRRSRIDEIPQLWNVIKGEMNLIGPRPERPEFFMELTENIPSYSERFRIKPGVTGWAQVHNGYTASAHAAKLKHLHDMFYINQKHRRYHLDAEVVWRTAKVVLTGFGAR